jgi:hypothetical protein
MTCLIALLLASADAQEVDRGDIGGGVSILLGTATAFDGNPATVRLSVRGEGEIADAEIISLNALLPVTLATQGQDGFGVSGAQTFVELPPSLRVRLLPKAPISAYGDVGAGLAVGTSEFGGWFFDDATSNVAFMTRLALGAEIGSPGGLTLIVEPVNIGTYHGQGFRGIYGVMIGLGTRI